METRERGNWNVVIKLAQARDEVSSVVRFSEGDVDAVKEALTGMPGPPSVTLEDGDLRVAIIVSDKSAREAWGLAIDAAGAAIFGRSGSPQLWEISIHTTGAYVTT